MTIPSETKEMLLRLRDRLPPERREAFVASVSTHLRDLASSNTAYCTLMGGLTGYLLGRLPGVGLLTHDHEIGLGALVGVWVGLAKDLEERKRREATRSVVEAALRDALA